MVSNAAREWFISYAPPDPRHTQALRADILARGPFSSREDTMAEIERIKNLDEFKGVALTAVRVDILSEESVAATPTDENPKPLSIAPGGAAAGAGKPAAPVAPANPQAGANQS
jgi:hypothetical protein